MRDTPAPRNRADGAVLNVVVVSLMLRRDSFAALASSSGEMGPITRLGRRAPSWHVAVRGNAAGSATRGRAGGLSRCPTARHPQLWRVVVRGDLRH